ncbi:hypothetical protein E1162_12870 [Rhodobacteraceae bacterium RKSG542]|uniref:Ig-like domain repeat protein n=1 Tax=Pseudovibrio flavus TaxID=2529854 RepID=UPI0012BC7E8F|nr:Ig-like domain repeat protein [Pseudovibrio flavus]MTI18132.1 hypothetical protein [Pseudovibrio flavus]
MLRTLLRILAIIVLKILLIASMTTPSLALKECNVANLATNGFSGRVNYQEGEILPLSPTLEGRKGPPPTGTVKAFVGGRLAAETTITSSYTGGYVDIDIPGQIGGAHSIHWEYHPDSAAQATYGKACRFVIDAEVKVAFKGASVHKIIDHNGSSHTPSYKPIKVPLNSEVIAVIERSGMSDAGHQKVLDSQNSDGIYYQLASCYVKDSNGKALFCAGGQNTRVYTGNEFVVPSIDVHPRQEVIDSDGFFAKSLTLLQYKSDWFAKKDSTFSIHYEKAPATVSIETSPTAIVGEGSPVTIAIPADLSEGYVKLTENGVGRNIPLSSFSGGRHTYIFTPDRNATHTFEATLHTFTHFGETATAVEVGAGVEISFSPPQQPTLPSGSFLSDKDYQVPVTVSSSGGPTPTGQVALLVNGYQRSPVALDSSGSAVLTLNTTNKGDQSIAVRYLGDDVYFDTSSAAQTWVAKYREIEVELIPVTEDLVAKGTITYKARVTNLNEDEVPKGDEVTVVGIGDSPVELRRNNSTQGVNYWESYSKYFTPAVAGDVTLTASYKPTFSYYEETVSSDTTFSVRKRRAELRPNIPTDWRAGSEKEITVSLIDLDDQNESRVRAWHGASELGLEGGSGKHEQLYGHPTHGTATVTWTPTTAGTATIKLTSRASDVYEAATPVTETFEILKVTPKLTLSLSKSAAHFGDEITGTASFTYYYPLDRPEEKITFQWPDGTQQEVVGSNSSPIIQYSHTWTANKLGDFEVTASFPGNSNFESLSVSKPLTVNARPVTLNLSAEPASGNEVEKPVQLTATVTDNNDSAVVPTGTVVFTSSLTRQIVATVDLDAAGTAETSYTPTGEGDYTVTAAYTNKDGHFAGATEQINLTVVKRPDGFSFNSSGASAVVDEPVTFQFSAGDGSERIATGNVTITATDQQPVTKTLADGMGTHIWTPESDASYAFTANYSGDAAFPAAERTQNITVTKRPLAVSLQSDISNPNVGAPVTFTIKASDESAAAEKIVPEGSVIITKNGADFGTYALDDNGAATFSWTPDAKGSSDFVASYAQNRIFAGAESPKKTIDVSLRAPEFIFSVNNVEPQVKETIIFSMDLREATGHSFVPSGMVELLINGAVETTIELVDGSATYEWTADTEGAVNFNATYLGDATFDKINALGLVVSVNRRAPTVTLISDLEEPKIGQDITLSIEAGDTPESEFIPTGEVDLLLDGNVLTTLTLADGKASHVWRSDTALAASFIARYKGDSTFSAQDSDSLSLGVERYDLDVSLTFSERPIHGQSVDLVANVDVIEPAPPATPMRAARTPVPVPTLTVDFKINGQHVGSSDVDEHGIARTSWLAQEGTHRFAVVVRGTNATNEIEHGHTTPVSPDIQGLFDEKREEVARIMREDALRAADARRKQSDYFLKGARERLRGGDEAVARAADKPLDYIFNVNADDEQSNLQGGLEGRKHLDAFDYVYYGDMSITRSDDLGTAVEFNTAIAAERRVSPSLLLAGYFGAEGSSTDIDGSLTGRVGTLGVNLGLYGAKLIGDSVVIDGQASLARLQHDMGLQDAIIGIDGEYQSTALQASFGISGKHTFEHFSIEPAMEFHHTSIFLEDASLDATVDGWTEAVAMGSDEIHETRFAFTPRFAVPLTALNDGMLNLEPSLICERLAYSGSDSETDCGYGMEMGLGASFAEGRGQTNISFESENVNDNHTTSLSLKCNYKF